MRWGDFRRSDNIEDRSGAGPTGAGAGIRLGGGAIIVVVVASLLFGVNPLEVIDALSGGAPPGAGPMPSRSAPAPQRAGPATPPSAPDLTKEMVAHVLGDTEDTWDTVFDAAGARYVAPRLVLFRGSTRSACGQAVTAVGPFYCSADREVYLDTAFFDELAQRFGAPGDFAQAYVIAHEVGHHVQNLTGTMERFARATQGADARSRNALSVRLELQADCYAGIWGHYAQRRNLLDPGDIEEGLRAAAAVGDDRIQREARGAVVPDSFTHGSSAQRVRWFRIGLETGDMRRCDTFSARGL
jgi:predicted metalloprotease